MTWAYDDGTDTPTFAGLVEIAGVRLNDGSFITEALTGLIDMPDVRVQVSPYATENGGSTQTALFGSRDIQIDGWTRGANVEDVLTACDYLRSALTSALGTGGLTTLIVNRLGWATRRQCDVQLAGRVVFPEQELTRKKVPSRLFTIPLLAPDPTLYDADNENTVTVPGTSTLTALPSAGTVPVPFTARFNGPFTTASLVRHSDGATIALDSSRLAATVGAGGYIDVTTGPGGVTAVFNDGSNAYAAVTDTGGDRLLPGSGTWSADHPVDVTWRDGWL